MHRSGTSALTRALGLSGAALPTNPMGASELNARGFFESVPIYRLHEELFEAFATGWDDLAPMPAGWLETGVANDFVGRMGEVVRSEFGDAPLFVVKDPRICRLVPFWLRVLERLDVEPLFVLPVRNPLEVSSSLARSQDIPDQQGRLLWLQHVLAAERDTRGSARVFVTYDQLMEDWRAVLRRVGDGLDIHFPRATRRVAAEIDEFLSEALRHHDQPSEKVDVREDVNDWVRRAWSWVERAAGSRPLSTRTLDTIAEAYFEAESAFGPVIAAQALRGAERLEEAERIRLEDERRAEAERERAAEERAAERDAASARIATIEEQLATRSRELEAERAELARSRELLVESEERVEAQRLALEQHSASQALLEMEPSPEPLGERVDGLADSMRKLLLLWAVEMRARGVGGEGFLEPILESVSMADGTPIPEGEWVQKALEAGASMHDRRDEERKALEESLADARLRLAEQEAEHARLQRVEAELAHAMSRVASAESRVDEWVQTVDVRDRELTEARAVASEVEGLRDRAASLTRDGDAMHATIASLETELRELRNRHHESELAAERERDALSRELASLREADVRAQSLSEEIARIDGERAELASAHEEAERELARLRERSREMETLEAQVEEQAARIEREQASVASAAERVAELDAALAARSAEADRVAELQDLLRTRDEELRGLRSEALKLPKLRSRLLESESALERAVEEGEIRLAERTQEIRGALEEREVEIARLRGEAATASHLRTDLEIREDELASAATHYEDLRSHAERLEETHASTLRELEKVRMELDQLLEEREAEEEHSRLFSGEDARFPGPLHRLRAGEVERPPSRSRLRTWPRAAIKFLWAVAKLQLPALLRERRVVRRIRASGLFDDDYYRAHAPEPPEALSDPVVHYVRHGAREGRNPCAAFDTSFYLETNPDVVNLGSNPLDHYVTHGWKERRRPHPFFDLDYYLATNPDVAESGVDPLRHWLHDGWRERRRPIRGRVAGAADHPGRSSRERRVGRSRADVADPVGASRSARAPGPSGARAERVKPLTVAAGPRATFSVRALDVDVERTADDRDPVVLVVTHELPHPPRAGNQYRIARYIHWLRERGNQVLTVCCPLGDQEVDAAGIEAAARALENLIVCGRDGSIRSAVSDRWQRVLRGLDGGDVEPLSQGLEPLEGEDDDDYRERVALEQNFCPHALARLVLHLDAAIEGPAVVVTNYVWVTRYLPLLRSETLSVIDTHDMFSSKQEKVDAFGITNQLRLTPSQERSLLLRGDVTMAIQAEEARAFAELVPERSVLTIGVDFDSPAGTGAGRRRREAGGAGPVLALIGSGNAMNVKGANDFLRFAWPIIQREHPEARLRVAGAVCAALPREVPGVELLGQVDSLEDFYAESDVVLNPTAAGTGLKIKTVEAIAHGRPVVAWPLGLDGVPEPLLRFCRVARDWYAFARAAGEVLEALAEGHDAFSDEDRVFIRESLRGANVYAELGDLVDRHCREGVDGRTGLDGREGAGEARTIAERANA